jgi:GTPase
LKFIDEVTIVVESGKGGDGCSSFRREMHVAFGGPDGGDGGRGGDVLLVATRRKNTLLELRSRPIWKAKSGVPGRPKKCAGAKGKSIEIMLPVGTRIFDHETGEQLIDLVDDGQVYVVAQGGKGGLGNVHFKSSTNRTPRKSTTGVLGIQKKLRFELLLMAEVGLLGYPNAGKSTFISRVSAARPKVAGYPFTTLAPKLGVVDMGIDGAYTIADIPGLIKGASDGVGLGHQFLRHIQRTKILLHLVSMGQDEDFNPIDRYNNIRKELLQYDEELTRKIEIIALTKADLVDAEEQEIVVSLLREEVGDKPIFVFSSVSKEGIEEVKNYLWQCIQDISFS